MSRNNIYSMSKPSRYIFTRAIFAALTLVMISWVEFVAASTVESVRVWRSPERTRVVFDLSSAVNYKYFSLANPSRFVLDLPESSSRADFSSIDFSGTVVSNLRGAKREDGRLRLVLDLNRLLEPEVFALPANDRYGDRLVVDFYDDDTKKGGSKARPEIVKTIPGKDEKRDIIIALDPGHGGEDPGASGPGKIREKEVVLSIAKELKKRIDAMPGYKARLIRTGDYYIALKKRRQMARDMQADAFISIHADAFHNKKVFGSSVYTLSADGASSATAKFLANQENEADNIGGVPVPEDDMLAGVIWELSMEATMDSSRQLGTHLIGSLKPVAKLHKKFVEYAGFAVLKAPDIPSVLLETGFISNPSEARKLASRSYQKKLASAVAGGIDSYFREYAVEGTLIHWQAANGVKEQAYKVRRGDTLSELADRYSITMAALKNYNGLKSDRIRIGQTIKIPPKKP